MAKKLSEVDGTYGAPMGRHSYGILENCDPKSVSVSKIRLDSGGYDEGGAYWGIPNNLYYAHDDNYCYEQFVRAWSREEALEKLGITPDYLHVLKRR